MHFNRWLGVRLEFIGNLIMLAAALFSVLQTNTNGAAIGLSLSYSGQVKFMFVCFI